MEGANKLVIKLQQQKLKSNFLLVEVPQNNGHNGKFTNVILPS